ncbi:MAG: prolyl oligopeptidase family serine peptidase [Candidatus Latescibacteria bacterium]|nr:prolyl oligopeptidase family serine peptidase [Candidatus Latescibacterota bacterium]
MWSEEELKMQAILFGGDEMNYLYLFLSALVFLLLCTNIYAEAPYRFRVRKGVHHDVTRPYQNGNWEWPVDEAFIRAFDGLYIPAVIAKPDGNENRRPVIVLLFAGTRGLEQAYRSLTEFRGMVAERLLKEGFTVCIPGYRVEMDDTYIDSDFPAILDHHDVMAVLEYLKRRDDIDPDRIGLYGVSHGGELICKIISETNLAGAVAVEPANVDFLNYPRMGRGSEIDEREPLKDSQYDRAFAMERVSKIQTPVVILNRTNDHLTGIFKTTYLLMQEAGVPSWEWEYEHEMHGFSWGPRGKEDGAYKPDAIQLDALKKTVEFFQAHVMNKSE